MSSARRTLLFTLFAVAVATWGAVPDTAQPAASPLDQLQWLVGDWHASAKSPDGTVTEIDSHIYWSETRTVMFFVTRFNGQPQYSGMYAYDPAQKQVGFWYADKDGQFTKGTATPEGKRLLQKFDIAKIDGTTSSLVSVIERGTGDTSYHWQVFRAGETSGKPLIELEYTKR